MFLDIDLHHGNGWKSTAVYSLINSPVRSLQYTFSGDRMIVGHECGKVSLITTLSDFIIF